jgi:hypothetical protein
MNMGDIVGNAAGIHPAAHPELGKAIAACFMRINDDPVFRSGSIRYLIATSIGTRRRDNGIPRKLVPP